MIDPGFILQVDAAIIVGLFVLFSVGSLVSIAPYSAPQSQKLAGVNANETAKGVPTNQSQKLAGVNANETKALEAVTKKVQNFLGIGVVAVLVFPFASSAILALIGDISGEEKITKAGKYIMMVGFGLIIYEMFALFGLSLYRL